MSTLSNQVVEVLTTVETALKDSSVGFGGVHIGPVSTDRISYPMAHVLPENTSYMGGNTYQHTVAVMFVFEHRGDVDYEAALDDAGVAEDAVLDALQMLGEVGAHRTESVDHLAGDEERSLLTFVTYRFVVDTQVDLATR